MTQEQYKEFREDFTSIVWYRGQVTAKKTWIGALGKWDKNNSHKAKIEEAIRELAELRKIVADKLAKYDKTYDELKAISKQLSVFNQRIKITDSNYEKYKALGLKHKINSAKGAQLTAQLNFKQFSI